MSDRPIPTVVVARDFKRALLQRFSLRSHMGWILAGVAFSAILANSLLRAYGLRSMPVRYALATTLAYAVFYLLVWIWLAYVSRSPEKSADPSDVDAWGDGGSSSHSGGSRTSSSASASSSSRPVGGGGRSGGGGASASFAAAPAGGTRPPETRSRLAGFLGSGKSSRSRDKSDDSKGGGPLGALGALLVFILPLIVIGAVCYYLVSTAPDLLGEIAFQAILARAILGRAAIAGSDSWLNTAFRRTLVPFAIVLVVVVVAGGYAQYRCPPAATLVEVLRFCGF